MLISFIFSYSETFRVVFYLSFYFVWLGISFGHRTGHTPPATMDHPGQWDYVATRLIARMGAYSPDEMNGIH